MKMDMKCGHCGGEIEYPNNWKLIGDVKCCENCVKSFDVVNSPSHYMGGGLETIKIIRSKMTDDMYEGYLLGNILKYSTRYRGKNGLEDLKKCRWYLDELIKFKSSGKLTF